jgi:hypothetical protein
MTAEQETFVVEINSVVVEDAMTLIAEKLPVDTDL